MIIVTKICDCCGKEFKTNNNKQRSCSRSCAKRTRDKEGKLKPYKKIKEGGLCQYCGKLYDIAYPQQSRTCCPECNVAFYAKRTLSKKEKAKEKPKVIAMGFKEIIPHVNTGDDFARAFIGRKVEI